jgi:hypothetical protein
MKKPSNDPKPALSPSDLRPGARVILVDNGFKPAVVIGVKQPTGRYLPTAYELAVPGSTQKWGTIGSNLRHTDDAARWQNDDREAALAIFRKHGWDGELVEDEHFVYGGPSFDLLLAHARADLEALHRLGWTYSLAYVKEEDRAAFQQAGIPLAPRDLCGFYRFK